MSSSYGLELVVSSSGTSHTLVLNHYSLEIFIFTGQIKVYRDRAGESKDDMRKAASGQWLVVLIRAN